MFPTVKDFVKVWKIGPTSSGCWLEEGWTLSIGMSGETAPTLTAEDYAVCVGFTVRDQTGTPVLPDPTAPPSEQPLVLVFDGITLRWAGYSQKQPLQIFIALAPAKLISGATVPYLYGTTIVGDPDQVGVWGADAQGSPPHPDPQA
ncbi:MAG TPA: hypothetical protein PK413_10990 [Thermoanaerobaculia bacterium]|nr:hypothetical protein [Thermoanaerobaculia bacterium]